jgi:hypothetical protein
MPVEAACCAVISQLLPEVILSFIQAIAATPKTLTGTAEAHPSQSSSIFARTMDYIQGGYLQAGVTDTV